VRSLSKYMLLGIFIAFYCAQLSSTHYDEQKTNELMNYLTELVRTLDAAQVKPCPRELLQRVKEYIAQGANPNISDDINGSSAIHFAAEAGDVSLLEFLLLHNVDIESKNFYKFTPLHWAARFGHIKFVKRLITLGANISAHCE